MAAMENSDSDNDTDNISEVRILPAITKTFNNNGSGTPTEETGSTSEYVAYPMTGVENGGSNNNLRSREKELPIRRKLDETNL